MEPEFRNEEGERFVVEPGDRTAKMGALGSSAAETLCGAITVILAVIGLAGAASFWMMGICSIVIGAGLLARGAGLVAETRNASGSTQRNVLFGGSGIELLAGAVAVLFGILALADVAPYRLLGVTCIVLGCALLLSSGALLELVRRPGYGSSSYRETGAAAGGYQVLAGVATVIFGIVALAAGTIGTQAALILVSFLAVAGALLFAGTASGARFIPEARVHH